MCDILSGYSFFMIQKSRSESSFLSENKNDNIISQNPFYLHLSTLMEDETFKNINELYFNRWSDIEVFILYVKLYNIIDIMITENHSKEFVINVIHVLMSHTESRRKLIHLFQEFKNDDASFSDIVKQYIETQSHYLLCTENHLNNKNT